MVLFSAFGLKSSIPSDINPVYWQETRRTRIGWIWFSLNLHSCIQSHISLAYSKIQESKEQPLTYKKLLLRITSSLQHRYMNIKHHWFKDFSYSIYKINHIWLLLASHFAVWPVNNNIQTPFFRCSQQIMHSDWKSNK